MAQQETNTIQTMPVSAILLAAGQGSRMGGGKLLLPIGDATVVERAAKSLIEVPVADLIIVVGTYGLAIKRQLSNFPARFVFNPDPSSEMAESIRCGLKVIDPASVEAFLILPADMPLVLPETIRTLVDSLLASDKLIAVPVFQGRRGHPVIFRSDLYEIVLNFRSPQGIRPLVHGDPSKVLLVEVDDEGVIADLDNWDDYRRLIKLWEQRRQK
jgi:CTP:molybdopterin cytidylyltransferase MocA